MPLFSSVSSEQSPEYQPLFEKIKSSLRRFFNVFFYGLGLITFLGICLKVFLAIQMHSNMSVVENTALKLDLDTILYESRPTDFMGSITFGDSPTIADVVAGLDRAAKDKKITLLFASLTKSNLSLAQVQEIREAVAAFKKTGKKTIVFAPTLGELGGGLSTYYLASAFDEIWVQPTGEVGVSGLGVEMPYIHNALKKIGIKPSFEARYEYKTGADMMTASHMSDAERKNLTSLMNSFLSQITNDVAQARGLNPQQAKNILISGPYFADKAKELKLIDHVDYGDVLDKQIKDETKEVIDFFDYAYISEPVLSVSEPAVAYIPATGIIQFGESVFGGDSYSSIMGVTTISDSLRQAADDDTIKAIVVRIDSPGGGYTPSDALWRELIYIKQVKNKPIVCSMSSTAASGGYFISLGCDKVFAQPATLTGSIGVFGGKLVFSELLKKLDVTVDSITIGKNAGLMSMAADFTPSQKKYFNDTLDRIYNDFTAKVSERRKITPKKLDSLARGRVFTGQEAVGNGLVDGIGGITAAVNAASEMAGHKKPLPLIEYPRTASRMEMLVQFLESGSVNVLAGKPAVSNGYLPALKSWAVRLTTGDMRLLMPWGELN